MNSNVLPSRPDVLSDVDHVLAGLDTSSSPWETTTQERNAIPAYVPDLAALHDLLAVPIAQGHATKQQSGRVAKSLDAYIAHELRRAGFPASAVFPRARHPRVLSSEFAEVEEHLGAALTALADYERSGRRLGPPPLRAALTRLARAVPGTSDAHVLGRFYTKQVDVVVSDWRRGPDILVSSKTMFSSYLNNRNNRYEEAIGEAKNLRDRYPLAAMGYAYIVRDNVYDRGAFDLMRSRIARLRRPDGPFDATVLLVGSWDEATRVLRGVSDPSCDLSLSRFFGDLLGAVLANTPGDTHTEVRRRRTPSEPPGGFPRPDVVSPS